MKNNVEKSAYGSNLTVFSLNGNAKIPIIYGGVSLNTETSVNLLSENNNSLATEENVTAINIKVENADGTSYMLYSFVLASGQSLGSNDYIDSDGLHIDGETISFTSSQLVEYRALQDIPLYEGISHITVTDTVQAKLKLEYSSVEEENQIYVLNKNEQLLAVFNKDDEDTLINPKVEKKQNSEAVFTFTIDMNNPKWEEINNPENLYLVDGMMFSTNFDGSFKESISQNDEKTVEVTAYERQQLLSRKYVRVWNSETNLETIDTFMVVILSNGNLPLKNDDITINTRYPKGSSGYALEGLLYGTGWTVGTCDIYEYENGEVVKDESDNPVYAKFDLETDQTNIYDNILKIQELWGGILVFDSLNKIVHHRNETIYLPYNGYEVRYQKNMQSLEKQYNNRIITKLCPLGEGGLNIKSVNYNNVWLENYSYTNTVLEGIENNPDITDAQQLKRWGERKLQTLCRPSIELDVNVALLYQLEGYELEDVNLNQIVDVIDYEEVYLSPIDANGLYPRNNLYPGDEIYPFNDTKKKVRLRVVEFSYFVWNKSDATIKLSNITLDSTDIFRKTLIATNSVNAGTLNASKVIAVYKGGQSLEATIFNIDEEKLNEEDFTGSNIMLAINEDNSSVTISANKINLNGVVTANQNFKIKTDGSMEAVNGKFTGNIEGSDIVGGTIKLYDINGVDPALTISREDSGTGAGIMSDNIGIEDISDEYNYCLNEIRVQNGRAKNRIYEKVNNVVNEMIITSTKITHNGDEYFVSKGVTTADLDNLTDTGFYYIGNTSVNNTPSGFGTWYGILVIKAFQNGGYTFQLAYKPSAGKFAMREYSGGPAHWTAWRIFSA